LAIGILYWASGYRLFVFQGVSMMPAVASGDHLLARAAPWEPSVPDRFDLVVFDVPTMSKWAAHKIPWMKRVVGLPGEHVKLVGAELYIDGRKQDNPFIHSARPPSQTAVDITLGADQYFFLGDNLDHSFDDSRTMGPIDGALIRGIVAGVIHTSREERPLGNTTPVVNNALVFTGNLGWHLLLYVTAAGGAYLVFHVLFKRWLAARQIRQGEPGMASMRRDILYSLSSMVIFALVGVLTHHLVLHGWTKLYFRIERHGWTYFWFSLVAMIALHDTWFYWTHRMMHWRRLFPIMHRVHHLSRTPTPWSALAFHPTEAIVHAIIFPFAAMLLPLHPSIALLWLVYMIAINVWGHLGFELFPAGFRRHWLFRWHNTTTHHDMHHQYLNGNYSLYFNFWDRVMRTNHPDY
jgi:signal peptidase I